MPKNDHAPKTLLESLDALVAKHHLLKHPFYKAWTEGQLSKAELGLYAEQYYQHVRSFPENLKQLAARTKSDRNLNSLVNENLAEELDAMAPHPLLWRMRGLCRASRRCWILMMKWRRRDPRRRPWRRFTFTKRKFRRLRARKFQGCGGFMESRSRGRWLISRCMKKRMCGIARLGESGWCSRRVWIRLGCCARRS